MKYRKKPVVIEAQQITSPTSLLDVMRWVDENGGKPGEWRWDEDEQYLTIETLEGDMRASNGDWIIRGVAGEFYPCKPEIFAATYEPATTTPENHHVTGA